MDRNTNSGGGGNDGGGDGGGSGGGGSGSSGGGGGGVCSLSIDRMVGADIVVNLSNGSSNPLRSYQVVVATTRTMGIGKDGKLPELTVDLKFLKRLQWFASDHGKRNAIIIGRKTWESIPPEKDLCPIA
ncbi:hypothetical protein IFM89_035503 [Coptis chinensis]|uniref:dihydrofolate reductase n=1 Tax=Coptis chinensis TaxID=261450 RepID=A0A835HB50_9MAGN|nr:hypothetical protein IFM89_035503 [Coptis chinensis]